MEFTKYMREIIANSHGKINPADIVAESNNSASIFVGINYEAAPAMPEYKSDGAAGFDLAANTDGVIAPNSPSGPIPTGISMCIPRGYYGRVAPRSGLAAKNSIDVLAGVVDSDYRGEVFVLLYNHGSTEFKYSRGDRIAQMIISPVPAVVIVPMIELPESERGGRGFGSTGV